jgi:hypothetical protein
MRAALLFEAQPMVHPDVLEAYERAIRVLRKARIPYRETGGPHGVPIKLWPEGTTHQQIARIRGMQKARPHPAGKLAFTLQGDAVVGLVNAKSASYLSAKDRLRDAADVQSLIQRLRLPQDFAARLAPEVRAPLSARLGEAGGLSVLPIRLPGSRFSSSTFSFSVTHP